MKILITGANGFLGRTLTDKLNKQYSVIPIARNSKNNNSIQCDISNSILLLDALNKYKPNVIINCAAKVDFSSDNNFAQYQINALSPAIMASWCVENNAHLLQTSSSIVNGNTATIFNTQSIEAPINYYGQTKLLADNAIKLSGCQYSIIRFGGIFGANGPTHLGINNAINNAKIGIVPTVVGEGKALRNYIHVQDAANLLIYCIENQITGLHYAGSHQSVSIAQMLTDICDVYLGEKEPLYKSGSEAIDQITEVSNNLPQVLSFKEALVKYK
jgi:dTDP-4-dehydrorhamnose reductase